jgi:hypothetical protein
LVWMENTTQSCCAAVCSCCADEHSNSRTQ